MNLFNLFSKNNKIILHKKNGQIRRVSRIKGLTVSFRGKNSCIEIYEPYNFVKKCPRKRSKIRIMGDNNHIVIRESEHFIDSIRIVSIQDNNNIYIGKNFLQTGTFNIDFANVSNTTLSIGDNCMFGQGINFMMGDFHKIIDITTNERTNMTKKGIHIGNHVWLARNVRVMKDVSIADNTIVGIDSLVTKSCNQSNVLLAGSPAKIVKENVDWEI